MKNKIVTTFILLSMFTTGAYAASPNPSPKELATASPTEKPIPVSSSQAEKAKELKDKVASKIAELKVLSKRGFIGIIKSIKGSSLIVTSNSKDITVDTDDTTKITLLQKGKRTTLKLTDLKSNQQILVWGQYNKDEESLKAKAILSRIFSLNLSGVLKSIDKNTVVITDKSENKDYEIDITGASIKILKSDKTIGKAESKDLTEGDYIHIYATPKTTGDKTTIAALRVLDLPKSIIETSSKETPKATVKSETPSPKPTSTPKATTKPTTKPTSTATP